MTQVKEFKDLGISLPDLERFEGQKIEMNKLIGREVIVHKYKVGDSNKPQLKTEFCLTLQLTVDGAKRIVFSGSKYLRAQLEATPKDGFPFRTTIRKLDDDSLRFT